MVTVSKHTKHWGRVARAQLTQSCGGCCQVCQATTDLQFHVKGAREAHHHLDASARVSYYRQKQGEGRLALLCRTCHQNLHSKLKDT